MTNLFPNPSVETDLSDINFGWGTASGEQSTDWAQDGDYSIKITSSDGGWFSSNITVAPSADYVFSVYAKGAGSLKLGWRAFGLPDGLLDDYAFSDPVTLTGEPQQISLPLTTTNPLTQSVFVVAYNTTGGGVVWYTDWHQFEEGAVATPYPSGNPYARIRNQFQLRPY